MSAQKTRVSDSVSSRVSRALRMAVSKKFSAFTLVELIVVITILAILATIGFLALGGYSQDAKDAAVKANVRSVMTAISSESAITNNSPRYYVVHDAAAALTGSAVAYVDDSPVTLSGGDWNVAGTNYSAGNPDWAKLKLNPDKFKFSSAPAWIQAAFAAYDSKSVSVGALDAALAPTASGRSRATSFFQVTGTAPATGLVSVSGNFPAPTAAQVSAGAVAGLVKAPTGTGALVDGGASATSGGTQTAAASRYPGCDADDIYVTGATVQIWAACNAGPGTLTAYSSQSVALTDATAAGGPTAAQKAYMGAYYQWGKNEDVTTGGSGAQASTGSSSTVLGYFAKGAATKYDWLVDASQNDNLWGGTGSTVSAGTYSSLGSPAAMQGPCATGYHVPTAKEWCDAIVAVSPTQNGGAAMVCDANWHVEATANKFMTTFRLPLAGYRRGSSAAFYFQGTNGYYWAASTTGTDGYTVNLSTTNGVIPANNLNLRANGLSVRCLKN